MSEDITVNEHGGKQHSVKHRCQALFPRAVLEVARLRAHGHDVVGYEDDNYLSIPIDDHVGRALRHILLWQAGDAEDGTRDEHLVHAACRILMALEEQMIADEIEQDRRETEMESLRLEYGYGDGT